MDISVVQIKPSKNPLIYLDYEGEKLRTVIDGNNKSWFVINDICNILQFSNVEWLISRKWIKPFLSSAVLEAPDGTINLCLVNIKGVEQLSAKMQADKSEFISWLKYDAISNHDSTNSKNIPNIDLAEWSEPNEYL